MKVLPSCKMKIESLKGMHEIFFWIMHICLWILIRKIFVCGVNETILELSYSTKIRNNNFWLAILCNTHGISFSHVFNKQWVRWMYSILRSGKIDTRFFGNTRNLVMNGEVRDFSLLLLIIFIFDIKII